MRLRAAAVRMRAASGGDGEVAGIDVGRRQRRSGATANWGDGGEVGRGIWRSGAGGRETAG